MIISNLVVRSDPFPVGGSPVNEFTSLAEPEADFLLGGFVRVRAVDNVAALTG